MADPFHVAGFTGSLTLPAQLFSTGVIAYTTISDVRIQSPGKPLPLLGDVP
jgi:hypothetical protein